MFDSFDDLFPAFDEKYEERKKEKANAVPLSKECPECGWELDIKPDPLSKGTYRSCRCGFYAQNVIGNVNSYLKAVMLTMAYKSLSWCPICNEELEENKAINAWKESTYASPPKITRTKNCKACQFNATKQGFNFSFSRGLGQKARISTRSMSWPTPTNYHCVYGKFNYEKSNWELSIPSINFKRDIENILELKKYDIEKVNALMALK